ncbi:sugar transferase [Phormidium sp. CCY1219]|uniref:sugar transferase n=1 Tax=Phormidium sp. CCY1219 TaxID=2886104 RepID=UPI002D1F4F11|nr:sugar transferase [Phormidium sp. CCY1219]MEB3828019.1 sugar transferase [Phormidium sp. CCY1219]
MVSQSPQTEFSVSFKNDSTIVHLPPRLSVLEAVPFKQTCHDLCDSEPAPGELILDFSQTTFIDSSGVGALVRVLKTTEEKDIRLVLRNVQAQVMSVLSLTALDEALSIEQLNSATQSAADGETSETGQSQREKNAFLPTTHPSVRSKIKRLMDILGALVGLGITGAILLPMAIVIKLDTPGPIFFSQTRCGWMGRRFRIWKFRSMCNNAEALKSQVKNQVEGPLFKNENDTRITRVGKFLRRTSLDELPQFWNVLKGEMSLVGTRPPTPDEVERYEVPEWQRLDVKPGMTGEWQVHGRSQITNFEDVIRLDLDYQSKWSLLYDLKLILKTIGILFNKNSGAY